MRVATRCDPAQNRLDARRSRRLLYICVSARADGRREGSRDRRGRRAAGPGAAQHAAPRAGAAAGRRAESAAAGRRYARLDRLARRRRRAGDRHAARHARPLLGRASTRHVDERAVVVVERGLARCARRHALANDRLRRERLAGHAAEGRGARRRAVGQRMARSAAADERRPRPDEREEIAAGDPRGAAVGVYGRRARRVGGRPCGQRAVGSRERRHAGRTGRGARSEGVLHALRPGAAGQPAARRRRARAGTASAISACRPATRCSGRATA